mmetsp:Transcript_7497/g.22754  ORF Transcript_7497/g.22754 Transcript_7497/m.22754 type:complete len:227 (+) Transcript_7497:110-790(+)|eukprot:CAMPEP_0198733690 /NCGR_PEP_ID=MMETSP1475-20131203/47605_1 /TAXON_ID= ORGANISM="Unidentified sp., Strain CCMP1999" /NCGR_SAMPLE_ID=MMETSP1475 /ASSEMBLY_ACC=CAM_ASM_001111 /LENGTH=226 /DNA_ID=CAMNT_0044497027 /DNA_START=96 /DNA_END=776 /DNA_ORIENTATION=+
MVGMKSWGNVFNRLIMCEKPWKEEKAYAPSAVQVDGSDDAAVGRWLENIGMEKYKESFLKNRIDVHMLLTLNARDLREELGVKHLQDRRRIQDSIFFLASNKLGTGALPEDGRILTHLFNIRIYLSWIRFSIRMIIFACILTFLVTDVARLYIIRSAIIIIVAAMVIAITAAWRYLTFYNITERISQNILLPSNALFLPALFGAMVALIGAGLFIQSRAPLILDGF